VIEMFLALKEMRRAKVRFGLVVVAIGLLVFLILFQQSLQNSLLRGFTGALRSQSAPVLVYSTDGQRTLQASVLTPDLEALARSAEGVGMAGRIGQGTFTVTAGGVADEASLIGYETVGLGSPEVLSEGRLPDSPGEAVASAEDAADGFDVGDVVMIEPAGAPVTIVGLAEDGQLNVGPTLFVTYDGYLAAVAARNPDAGTPLPNALGVAPAGGTTPAALVAAIDARSDDLDALTRDQAADEAPGVAQVRQSFQVIFLLYALVVPFVTGLFFLIITVQKAGALTLLRAIGAPGRRLVAALLVQVVIIVGLGLLVGVTLYTPLTIISATALGLRFETTAVVGWSVALLVLGLASSLLAARRVQAIDPVSATTGAGLR
jgi:putative ABC transport system permease protein